MSYRRSTWYSRLCWFVLYVPPPLVFAWKGAPWLAALFGATLGAAIVYRLMRNRSERIRGFE